MSELPKEKSQSAEPTKEPEQLLEAGMEDDYDGYYDDVLPR